MRRQAVCMLLAALGFVGCLDDHPCNVPNPANAKCWVLVNGPETADPSAVDAGAVLEEVDAGDGGVLDDAGEDDADDAGDGGVP